MCFDAITLRVSGSSRQGSKIQQMDEHVLSFNGDDVNNNNLVTGSSNAFVRTAHSLYHNHFDLICLFFFFELFISGAYVAHLSFLLNKVTF